MKVIDIKVVDNKEYNIATLKNNYRFAIVGNMLIPNQGGMTPGVIATDEEIDQNFEAFKLNR